MGTSAKSDPGAVWWLYFMATANRRIYTGISPDPVRRFQAHCKRQSAHTRMNAPVALLGATPVGPYAEALKIERWAKRLSPATKEALARGYRDTPEWSALAGRLSNTDASRQTALDKLC